MNDESGTTQRAARFVHCLVHAGAGSPTEGRSPRVSNGHSSEVVLGLLRRVSSHTAPAAASAQAHDASASGAAGGDGNSSTTGTFYSAAGSQAVTPAAGHSRAGSPAGSRRPSHAGPSGQLHVRVGGRESEEGAGAAAAAATQQQQHRDATSPTHYAPQGHYPQPYRPDSPTAPGRAASPSGRSRLARPPSPVPRPTAAPGAAAAAAAQHDAQQHAAAAAALHSARSSNVNVSLEGLFSASSPNLVPAPSMRPPLPKPGTPRGRPPLAPATAAPAPSPHPNAPVASGAASSTSPFAQAGALSPRPPSPRPPSAPHEGVHAPASPGRPVAARQLQFGGGGGGSGPSASGQAPQQLASEGLASGGSSSGAPSSAPSASSSPSPTSRAFQPMAPPGRQQQQHQQQQAQGSPSSGGGGSSGAANPNASPSS